MSAAERAKKKRVRLSLFPEKHAAARKQDVARKLEAKERALDAAVREHEQDMRLYRLQLAASCVEWMVQYLEQWSMRMQAEYRQWQEENAFAARSTVSCAGPVKQKRRERDWQRVGIRCISRQVVTLVQ